jgi:hypothetical protein
MLMSMAVDELAMEGLRFAQSIDYLRAPTLLDEEAAVLRQPSRRWK